MDRIGPVRLVLAGLLVPMGLASLVVLGQPQSRWHLLVWGLLTVAALVLAGIVLLGAATARQHWSSLVIGALADLWVAGMNLEHRQTIPNVAYGQFREGIATLIDRGARDGPIPVAQHRDARVPGEGDRGVRGSDSAAWGGWRWKICW